MVSVWRQDSRKKINNMDSSGSLEAAVKIMMSM